MVPFLTERKTFKQAGSVVCDWNGKINIQNQLTKQNRKKNAVDKSHFLLKSLKNVTAQHDIRSVFIRADGEVHHGDSIESNHDNTIIILRIQHEPNDEK